MALGGLKCLRRDLRALPADLLFCGAQHHNAAIRILFICKLCGADDARAARTVVERRARDAVAHELFQRGASVRRGRRQRQASPLPLSEALSQCTAPQRALSYHRPLQGAAAACSRCRDRSLCPEHGNGLPGSVRRSTPPTFVTCRKPFSSMSVTIIPIWSMCASSKMRRLELKSPKCPQRR